MASFEQLDEQPTDIYLIPPRGIKEWLFVIVLCSTQVFVQGALGYILIPLHLVGDTFDQGPNKATQMTWHVGGYSLAVGTFILIAGKLVDLYGSKRIFTLGWVWFGVWSLIGGCSAFTKSPIFFDAARAVQGIGPAFLLPNGLAIAGRTYPPGKKKNMVFSAFAMCAPLGCYTAGLIGAAFAEYVWWPWVMWVYGIGCFIMAAIALYVVPADLHMARRPDERSFDYVGSVLGVAGLLLLNISWNQAPIDGWPTPYVYSLLILGFVLAGLFVLQEKRAADPILDISIFNRRVAAVLLTTGLGWSSFGIWLYYLFQFIQRFRGVSPLTSAVQFTPGAISGILAALATPYLMAVVSSGWLMVIACAAFFIGCLLQSTAPVEQSYWMNTFWSFVVTAWGMDVSFPALATILSDAVPVKHQRAAASLVNTIVNYSTAVGLGIAGTVEAEVVDRGGDLLSGYRAALWTSAGLSGLAFVVALVYAVCTEYPAVKCWRKRENTE
ncbi:putative MFS multidrug transporter [Aspergillus heterothallicus]